MRRVSIPELLGTGADDPHEIAAALADLRRINRWFGGVRVVRKLMEDVAQRSGKRQLTWLDVAAASGDIVAAVTKDMAARGVAIRPTLLDRSAHFPAQARAVQGDALALPFADGAFDVVSSSLLIHDLEPPEVARFTAEALRVSRVAVLINELRRSRLHLALVSAGLPLFRSRITHHDAVASVKKAYTEAELSQMLRGNAIDVRRFYLCRMGVIVWKPAPERGDTAVQAIDTDK